MTSSPPPPEPGEREAPTCFRHPKRETKVRCTRCERSICPDCMREAAVGHQCVECVTDGQRSIRQPRTLFGGRVISTPTVTYVLLALMALGHVGQLLSVDVTAAFQMASAPVIMGEFYRLLTGAFMHSGLGHLLLNGLAMYIFGRPLEAALGHARYLALWLLSAVGGAVLCLLVLPIDHASVGASGAVFGLIGALVVMGRKMQIDVRFLLVLLALNLVLSIVIERISLTAHLGGLVSGLLLGAAYAYLAAGSAGAAPLRNRTLLHTTAVVAFAVILTGLVLAKLLVTLG